ncbi:MAG: N-6 DNA methylase [Actinomycetota bacterium]
MGLGRKGLGAWYTPDQLVELVVASAIDADVVDRCGGRAVRVLDPACGDGRFLDEARRAISELGGRSELIGVDVDPRAVRATRCSLPDAHVIEGDALTLDLTSVRADVVIGNPPFLSQLSTATTRGGSGSHGAGTYGDAAVEFLGLASRVVEPDGGRVAFVLPQSVLSSRDATDVRRRYDESATMIWSSWSGRQEFDAAVHTCALVFEFGRAGVGTEPAPGGPSPGSWSHVVTERLGVPPLPDRVESVGTLGDHARLNANFRDEYYGLVPAVDDHPSGPPLVTTGLIDPGVCRWGERPVRFARRRLEAPRVRLDRLDEKMREWATRRLVPKVLVATQTRVLEAWADLDGSTLPGVPVVAAYPLDESTADVWCPRIVALLTSPFASAWAWHRNGGTGLSATTIRVGPTLLADLPWPAGDLDDAAHALADGDLATCGRLVHRAYGLDADSRERLIEWWLPTVEERRGNG